MRGSMACPPLSGILPVLGAVGKRVPKERSVA
jgi:hypothetical protein